VIRVQVPGLASHIEDFEDLLYFFAKQYRVGFTHAAIERLKQHPWPGNIRELRNFAARAKAYFGGAKIDVPQLKELLETPAPSAPEVPARSVLKDIECEMIRDRLVANQGNQRRTAKDLGMPKSTLHDRIQTYGIDVKQLLASHGVFVD
jgi:DNA-binding NtrC family response regulator